MSHLFQPDRSLLYPQFETYRLHSLDPTRDVSTYSLPGPGATQARVGYNSHLLSFKETRARIAFDHLATDGHRRGCYVDKEWNVIGFQVDDNLTPIFTTLASLPTPVSSSSSTQQSEYPCALNISPTLWILSTGSGSLYLLQTTLPSEPSFTGSLVARYDLTSPDGSSGQAFPFVLRNAHQVSDTEVKLLLSRSVTAGGKGQSKQTTFELLEFSLNPTQTNGVDDDPRPLKLNWRNVGGDLPLWTTWSRDGWLVLSGETYGPPVDASEEDEGEKAKRERREAIEKLGLGATVPLSTDTESKSASVGGLDVDMGDEEARDWPFSWKQNSDSLSISVPFAPGTARNHLSVGLTSTSFSLSVSPEAPSTSDILSKFLSKPSRSFWSEIDPSTSTWTFDPSRSVLDLDIVKVDTDVRWPSVFTPADGDDEMDDEEDVPETLDAAMLASVRETFNQIKTRGEDEPAGNHPAIPALIREEMDYDLEDGEDFGESTAGVFGEPGGGGKVGRDIFVGFIKDGQASFTKAQSSIISLPLAAQSEAVMVKSAVDGLLFSPPTEGSLVKTPWKHKATSPAISFVLSSKRDLRVVRHLNTESGPIVMAFDAGGSTPASGNVYVYYPPTSSTTARQGVVRVSGADRGALLGVGAVNVSGKTIPVALCEKEFVVLHGLEG